MWFKGQRERWCKSSPTIPLCSAYLQLELLLVFCGSQARNLQKDSPFPLAGAVKARSLGWGDSVVFSPGAGTNGPACWSGASPLGVAEQTRMEFTSTAAQNCQLQTLQDKRKKPNKNPKRLCLGKYQEVSEPKPTWEERMSCL